MSFQIQWVQKLISNLMPAAGDLIGKYGRQYRYIKPLDSEPGTFRLATPEEGTPGGTPGGGGTGGTSYEFDAIPPIEVSMTPGVGGNPTRVVTSMDLKDLNARTDQV